MDDGRLLEVRDVVSVCSRWLEALSDYCEFQEVTESLRMSVTCLACW